MVVYQLPFPLEATPVGGTFGDRSAFRANPHRGHDFSQYHLTRLGLDNTVTAVADGVVVTVLTADPVFGRVVVVEHADGTFSGYAHLASIAVRVGESVTRGQALGRVGSSGSVTDAHLHLNIGPTRTSLWRGTCWDPITFILDRRGGGAGGGGIAKQQGDIEMRIIFNKDSSDDDTRRAIVGELTFQVITGPQSTRERKFWGEPVNVTKGEWAAARDLVIARRTELRLPVSISASGSVGASKDDVDAAAARVIAKIPTKATFS